MKMNMAAPPKKDFMHLTFIPLLLCLFFFTTILKAQEDRRGIKIDASELAHRQSINVSLKLKLFIEGYCLSYDGVIPFQVMQAALYNNFIAQTLAGPFGTNDCDFIRVELHPESSPGTVYSSSPVMTMLHIDGNTDFTNFSLPGPGSYYIAILHRNAIETWSPAMSFSSGSSITYDFSCPTCLTASRAYGNNMSLVNLGFPSQPTGVWVFYSGDMDQDGNIGQSDFPFWDNDNYFGNYGYLVSDINGDVNVDLSDFPYWDNNNNNGVYTIHP